MRNATRMQVCLILVSIFLIGCDQITPDVVGDVIDGNGSIPGEGLPGGIVPAPEAQVPPASIILDNSDGDSISGNWTSSTNVNGFYQNNYQYFAAGSGEAEFEWNTNIAVAGSYHVRARWTQHANRASNAKYTVFFSGGYATVTVNQKENGGEFIDLGVFPMEQAEDLRVVLTNNANGFVIADAIEIEYCVSNCDEQVVVPSIYFFTELDNSNGAVQGTWKSSRVVSGFLGQDYAAHPSGSGEATHSWNISIPRDGTYAIYARWTAHPNRASNTPYFIETANGEEIIMVDQRANGAQFNLLGAFDFTASEGVQIHISNDADGWVIADSIRVVELESSVEQVSLSGALQDWLDAGVVVTALGLDGEEANITSNNKGLGIQGGRHASSQINHDPATDASEVLIVSLQPGETAFRATFMFSNLYPNERGGEQGQWIAKNENGEEVGRGVFGPEQVTGGSATGFVEISGIGAFHSLEFTAIEYVNGIDAHPSDSSDYYIRTIDFDIANLR